MYSLHTNKYKSGKRVWPQVLGIQTRPFPKSNLTTMKAFYNFNIKTKITSDISKREREKKKRLLRSGNEMNLASVL